MPYKVDITELAFLSFLSSYNLRPDGLKLTWLISVINPQVINLSLSSFFHLSQIIRYYIFLAELHLVNCWYLLILYLDNFHLGKSTIKQKRAYLSPETLLCIRVQWTSVLNEFGCHTLISFQGRRILLETVTWIHESQVGQTKASVYRKLIKKEIIELKWFGERRDDAVQTYWFLLIWFIGYSIEFGGILSFSKLNWL